MNTTDADAAAAEKYISENRAKVNELLQAAIRSVDTIVIAAAGSSEINVKN